MYISKNGQKVILPIIMFLLSLQYNVDITNGPQPAYHQVSDRKSALDVGGWQAKTDHES